MRERSVVGLRRLPIPGCTSIRINDDYPFLRGDGMQLDFRSHSGLGILAVFTRIVIPHGLSTRGARRPVVNYGIQSSRECFEIHSAFCNFQGKITRGGTPLSLNEKSQDLHSIIHDDVRDCSHCKMNHFDIQRDLGGSNWGSRLMALLTADIPIYLSAFPLRKLDIHAVVSCIMFQRLSLNTLIKCREQYAADLCARPAQSLEPISGLSLPSRVFKFGDSSYLDSYTGSDREKNRQDAHAISLLDGVRSIHRDSASLSWPVKSKSVRPAWERASYSLVTSENSRASEGGSQSLVQLSGDFFVVLPAAERVAMEWLEDPVQFARRKSDFRFCVRHLLLLQLYEIDFWLAKNSNIAMCVLLQMVPQAGLFLDVYALSQSKADQRFEEKFGPRDPNGKSRVLNNPIDQIFFKVRGEWVRKDDREEILAVRRELQYRKFSCKKFEWVPAEEESTRAPSAKARTPGLSDDANQTPNLPNDRARFHEATFTSRELAYYLCYRVALVGTMLALGVDNSDLLDLECMDQIVPFM